MFMRWLLYLSLLGICCILLFGRPGRNQSTEFAWKYTMPPSATPSPVLLQIANAAAGGVTASTGAGVTAPLAAAAAAAGTAAPEASVAVAETTTPAPPLTTAPQAFAISSVVNRPLREAVAEIAKNKPGVTIRPLQLGTTAPPAPFNANRVTVEYDPSTLTVTRVSTG